MATPTNGHNGSNGHADNSNHGHGSHGDSIKLSSGLQAFETLPAPNPAEIVFTGEEETQIKKYVALYPEKKAAVMRVLWLAQEKFGWLSEETIRLVAKSLSMPEADVFGVASFYTMYFKKPVGKTHLAVCTNISCMLCGGYELYDYIKATYHIGNGDITPDGKLSLEEAECLGSCGTAPMLQVGNDAFIENLTLDKLKTFLKERGL
ncbi:MAG: NAD(P)H-dependent oxidoreductase subunit E [Rhizobacter sp.]|nr:NAD(P)H-dependent oxidoreductase subunit E [Chlorobiales bacterium]